ncbi:FADH(2)-oxidizing methylenetetrahydrofolate--tRNA-(uracil(54)-C(5))-methyltransferase TrmFO [Vagococcus fluvialis]|jgi:methylenetetrahydrofolate--tRNA-(uracil-5-)-methyltransferase|uniref:Methylenetetrahydrofolate--tRNA-(uracil-5-)-methyltransferase TrmFO n=1 Tax=Vagococcus fluvialis TaxID=2738 RepID=A0A369B5A3_9ENTE|nr:FADH(2)-oxidizing methylenetetrahydrofolate--tRNA-(uracil(54)-C(5))-methyltransferase TrmFO [Vagococcus fluvialis]MBO0479008.1 FADH(2)-oxidizing methylenetetrahydrofolate--tRNA-(uracil(54)-C(5))-methyltransferase TrmFO [Vagococcus fluvialis]MBO0484082.1 FADH(2)-oxidizing methylenetetrahydrofolate--tRNA-(uracil(54)-C(5))-methyltransferase TrmFO [Vagococcus fluvialis]MBO0485984.1 FADH(2)-oxidizing methylenetetrahydrofolate--tRNA-(uracil(54)-C(5))-methyltransferase TrmFO [Vagococcus fluvialis]M
MSEIKVTVIGAGLAGSEAAFQAAEAGVKVDLYEMRKLKKTPAHHTDKFAELVCTNSLRANNITNAAGLLKEEMRTLDSVIISSADKHQVPAGGALAVDREGFSSEVTERVSNHPNITIHHEEITEIPEDGITIIATGPLTSEPLAESIKEFTESEGLYFYDAAAPIIDKNTIDMDKVYLKSRYDKGEAAYLNCPMNKDEFYAFREALVTAEVAPLKSFEKEKFFEGCMPIEVMANRGEKTMTFGPLKPVGLEDPKTGKRPYAVVQLRQDDAAASLFNIVGFQTHLKWGEQKRIIQMIPGLENAEIVRYGVMHRNTFMNSPELLNPTYQSRKRSNLLFAGQMTGVEGYIESAASGLVAGINAARLAKGEEPVIFPQTTAMGSMAHYITHTSGKNFQPMNVNFGIFPELPERIRDKKERYEAIANRALEDMKEVVTLTK